MAQKAKTVSTMWIRSLLFSLLFTVVPWCFQPTQETSLPFPCSPPHGWCLLHKLVLNFVKLVEFSLHCLCKLCAAFKRHLTRLAKVEVRQCQVKDIEQLGLLTQLVGVQTGIITLENKSALSSKEEDRNTPEHSNFTHAFNKHRLTYYQASMVLLHYVDN